MTDTEHPTVAAWLTHLTTMRGLSTNTIRTYRRTLSTLPVDPATATRDDLEAWAATRAHLSPATRNNELAALRAYYKWAATWDIRDDDPTLRLVAPKMPKGIPRPASRTDLAALLAASPPDTRRAVALGAYGGLRISEAAALHWHDIDTDTRRARVTGKGSKTRLVGVSPLLLDELLPDTGGNVVTGSGRRLTPDALQKKVGRACADAGVDLTFHQLRHRFGTVALAATGNLLAVSRAMGHATPTTTAIYAATADSDLDVIADAVSR